MPCFPWLFILNSLDLEEYVVKVQTTDLNCVTLLSKSNINIIFFKTWEFKWERAMKIWLVFLFDFMWRVPLGTNCCSAVLWWYSVSAHTASFCVFLQTDTSGSELTCSA